EDLHELRHGRALLTHGDVDAVKLLAFGGIGLMRRLLVEESVEDHGSLAGLAIADDKLALAAAEQALADRGVDDRAGALDGVAFLDAAVGAEDHDADIVGLEVERHALDGA